MSVQNIQQPKGVAVNIAILIGVSKYDKLGRLTACWHDVEAMHELLIATGKYSEIHVVREKTNANDIKKELRDFFTRHEPSKGEINEAFVYFSGHGTFDDEALLCCSDFDAERPKSTSIANSELDELLRIVAPRIAVKIIDACQSGSPYIKDANHSFNKSLERSDLKAFIAMTSSTQDQVSWASDNGSYFTIQWIDSALGKDEGATFYRDIQASVADAFSGTPQTPFFVTQGTNLEQFAVVTDAMRHLKVGRLQGAPETKSELTIESRIEAAVAKHDRLYVEQRAAEDAVNRSGDLLRTIAINDALVEKFYRKEVTFGFTLLDLPQATAIAVFAADQSWNKKYFCKINYESFEVRKPTSVFPDILSLYGRGGEAMETRYRAISLQATQGLPFEVASISFRSEHASLQPFDVFAALVHSKTEVMIVSATAKFKQIGWELREYDNSGMKWRYENFQWIDVVGDPSLIWKSAFSAGIAEIRSYLESFSDTKQVHEIDRASKK